jgi:predicted nucleic acid-binding protein
VIVADTGAILGLVDKKDRHHAALYEAYDARPDDWVLPWAILPEVDHLLMTHLGAAARETFSADLAGGAFHVEYGNDRDVMRAQEISRRHRALRLGLVDAVVMATAERLRARAIATLDLRHFGSVRLSGSPLLIPRDIL